jgi:hypothetical protein
MRAAECLSSVVLYSNRYRRRGLVAADLIEVFMSPASAFTTPLLKEM